MNNDPIVEEIRKVRHAHAEKFNNDVAAIFEDFRRIAKESGRQHVSYPPRRPEPSITVAPKPEGSQSPNICAEGPCN
jgi:hypothetical protein